MISDVFIALLIISHQALFNTRALKPTSRGALVTQYRGNMRENKREGKAVFVQEGHSVLRRTKETPNAQKHRACIPTTEIRTTGLIRMPRIHASPSAPETNNSTLLAPETNTIAVDNKNGVIVPAVQQETSSPDCISHAQVLVRLFSAMCSAAALRVSSISKIVKDISSHDEFTATLFGSESWNRLSLQELSQPSMYFDECCSDANREFLKWPTTVLSYGKRLEQGRLMLRRMFVPHQVEIVFLGTCLKIRLKAKESKNLYRSQASRCFNAVMLHKRAAMRVLETGVIVDGFLPVDHLFNRYIPLLGLNAFYLYPPIAYEGSKIGATYPCPGENN
ncbi:unnamed protein product [Vitrella brassicaformis CCMP3155]|uniref:Uncharacterized protein n=1 Tax=Vitrella brassicaformis (strain CCMP3155) TaxID=1169540 RepID=A0A0G4GWC2_VITBC|nr:unnamed protein product [Vitrella brassicaformis CCMP3155]|eukprot:CEM35185.1 unnamed protein product [Vitrella brassicaformis CCMP3155]